MSDDDLSQATAPALAQNNPYVASENLSALEAQVLGEYARMANNLKRVSARLDAMRGHTLRVLTLYDQLAAVADQLAATQPEIMKALVPLEKKLGLTLTLFKVSYGSYRGAFENTCADCNHLRLPSGRPTLLKKRVSSNKSKTSSGSTSRKRLRGRTSSETSIEEYCRNNTSKAIPAHLDTCQIFHARVSMCTSRLNEGL